MSAMPDADDTACPNCGRPLTGAYCAHCGQKTAPLAPTLGYFVDEVTHELANVDGKIYRSLRLLFSRPGFLTRETFAGKRASYVSPIRLYLTASVLAFAMRAMFGEYAGVTVEYIPDPGEVVDPAVLARTIEIERTVEDTINVWLPRAMFVLVPLFAALVMLFRRRGGHTYPLHLYFALHFHAVWFFAEAVALLIGGLITYPLAADVANATYRLYGLAYFFVAFRCVYGTTIWGTLWREAAICLSYFVAMMLALLAIAAPILWPIWSGSSPP
jgi:hypothetical protein